MNRAKSRTLVIRSKVAAICLLLAGGAIALTPTPFGGASPKSGYKEPPPPPPRGSGNMAPLDVNLAALAQHLGYLTRPLSRATSSRSPERPRPLLNELRCVFFQATSRLGRYNSARDV